MKFLSTLFRDKKSRKFDLKNRVLKNKEAVLDAFSENIRGARQCPFLLGAKCIGSLCEFFMQFELIDEKTKEKKTFHRCAFTQLPLLMIELRETVDKLKGEKNE